MHWCKAMGDQNYWAWRMAKASINRSCNHCYVDFQLACKAGIIFG